MPPVRHSPPLARPESALKLSRTLTQSQTHQVCSQFWSCAQLCFAHHGPACMYRRCVTMPSSPTSPPSSGYVGHHRLRSVIHAGRAGLAGIVWGLAHLVSLSVDSTSNRAGSRGAGSRCPWSSAELATRPVRKGRSKPKENAPDSRNEGGHAGCTAIEHINANTRQGKGL